MSIAQINRTRTLALLSCSFAISGAANAAMLQLDFSATYNEIRGEQYVIGNLADLPADVTVSGTVTWDSSLSPFLHNGVSNRAYEYTSFDAVVEGSFVDFDSNLRDVGITPSTPAVPDSFNNLEVAHHNPTNGSSLTWNNVNWSPPAGFGSGVFSIHSGQISAMPFSISPLPSAPGDYYGAIPFWLQFRLQDFGASTHYSFHDPVSTSFVVTEVPTPGAAALFGIAGLVATRRRRR